MSQFFTSADYFTIIPAVMLVLFGCAILLFDFLIFPDPRQRKWLVIFVALAEGFAGYGLYQQYAYLTANGLSELTGFQGSVTVDGFGIFFNWIFVAAALIVAMVSYKYLEIAGEHHGEYYALMLFAQCGMYFLATGTDLITLFIGLELMALCFYVMVGFLRTDKRSNEAAMKYLLLGAFSSGFLVYGFSRDVRHGRLHQAGGCRGGHRGAVAVGPGGVAGDRHHLGGAAVQDFGGALPHVGAGRLRRRAHHRDGVSFGGFEGGLHGLPAAHFPRSAGLIARSLGAAAGGCRGGHPDAGEPGRHQSDQYQAAAGVQFHLARRLHAAGPGGRQRHRHQRHRGVYHGVHIHEPGGVPGGGGAAPPEHHRRRSGRYLRPDAQEPPATPS